MRIKILQFLKFIPDKAMVKLQYKIKTGRKLNLKNPTRFTEKLQWYKLYYRNDLMIRCVDKYDVRKYVEDKGLERILIPCYGVYNKFEEINIKELPDKFVMKDTLGGGGVSVIIIENKNETDIEQLKGKATQWVETPANYIDDGREWPYYSGKRHRIIIEKLIDSNIDRGGLIDYKFFCFNGEVKFLYVLADRVLGNDVALGIFDRHFQQLPVYRTDERKLSKTLIKPEKFDEMIDVAEILSKNFPHARVDLFFEDNQIYFGEITFFDGSGYMKYEPDDFDEQIGTSFELPY